VGVAVSYLISTIIFLYPVFAVPFKIILLSPVQFFLSFKEILLSSIIMFLVSLAVMRLILINSSLIVQLIVLIPLSIGIYILSLQLFGRQQFKNFVNLLKEGIS